LRPVRSCGNVIWMIYKARLRRRLGDQAGFSRGQNNKTRRDNYRNVCQTGTGGGELKDMEPDPHKAVYPRARLAAIRHVCRLTRFLVWVSSSTETVMVPRSGLGGSAAGSKRLRVYSAMATGMATAVDGRGTGGHCFGWSGRAGWIVVTGVAVVVEGRGRVEVLTKSGRRWLVQEIT
jgi:hypothetical protein